MSTLKTSNIQDTSGNNNSTPAEISQGRAKAWVNYDQANNSIRDSFNVASITDHSTGLFTITFSNSMPNANYSFAGSVGHMSPAGTTTAIFSVELPDGATIGSVMTTSSLQLEVNYVTSTADRSLTDREYIGVNVFGD